MRIAPLQSHPLRRSASTTNEEVMRGWSGRFDRIQLRQRAGEGGGGVGGGGDGAAEDDVVRAEPRGLRRGGDAGLVAGVVARQADAGGEDAEALAHRLADR